MAEKYITMTEFDAAMRTKNLVIAGYIGKIDALQAKLDESEANQLLLLSDMQQREAEALHHIKEAQAIIKNLRDYVHAIECREAGLIP